MFKPTSDTVTFADKHFSTPAQSATMGAYAGMSTMVDATMVVRNGHPFWDGIAVGKEDHAFDILARMGVEPLEAIEIILKVARARRPLWYCEHCEGFTSTPMVGDGNPFGQSYWCEPCTEAYADAYYG